MSRPPWVPVIGVNRFRAGVHPDMAERRRTRLILIRQVMRMPGGASSAASDKPGRRDSAQWAAPVPTRDRLGRALSPGARTALLRVLPAKLFLGRLDLLHSFRLDLFLLYFFLLHLFLLHRRPRQC